MLALRPTCEHCNKALPPHSTEALICSYECTFCASCAHEVLHNVCPKCWGGLQQRPIRPQEQLAKHPASTLVVHKPVDLAKHQALLARYAHLAPHER